MLLGSVCRLLRRLLRIVRSVRVIGRVSSLWLILRLLSLLVALQGGRDMSKNLEERRKSIMRGNPKMKEELAYAIATKQLQREGKLKKKKKG
jgi:hypothetical protein